MPQATAIAIAVVERDGCFLIGPRPDGAPLAGLWEFPGGKVEAGESIVDAAVRECVQETRIDIQVTGREEPVTEGYSHDTVQLHFVHGTASDPSQVPNPPFRWVPRNQLSRYQFPSGNREFLRKLLTESVT